MTDPAHDQDVAHHTAKGTSTVKMRPLGRTGIQVSPYCLGTMLLGQAGNTDLDDCVRIIHRALDAGINFVDIPAARTHPSLRRRAAAA